MRQGGIWLGKGVVLRGPGGGLVEDHARGHDVSMTSGGCARGSGAPAASSGFGIGYADFKAVKRTMSGSRVIGLKMGLTRVEVLFVIAIVGFLVFWAWTGTVRDRGGRKAARINCINNLKNLGLAFRTFSLPAGDSFPGRSLMSDGVEMGSINAAQIFGLLTNGLSDPKMLICPADKMKRRSGSLTNLTLRNVSYFASLSADETMPTLFLAGDRNLATNGVAVGSGLFELTTNGAALSWTKEIHNEQGDVLMADGSVQQMSSSRLRSAVRDQEVGTNYLVIP